MPLSGSAFEKIDFGDVDGAAIAEVDDDDGKPDCGLRRRHSEHDHGEDLPDQVAVKGGKGHEVEIHREQHQLDRHEDDDHVLAIEKDAENTEREQEGGEGEIME